MSLSSKNTRLSRTDGFAWKTHYFVTSGSHMCFSLTGQASGISSSLDNQQPCVIPSLGPVNVSSDIGKLDMTMSTCQLSWGHLQIVTLSPKVSPGCQWQLSARWVQHITSPWNFCKQNLVLKVYTRFKACSPKGLKSSTTDVDLFFAIWRCMGPRGTFCWNYGSIAFHICFCPIHW